MAPDPVIIVDDDDDDCVVLDQPDRRRLPTAPRPKRDEVGVVLNQSDNRRLPTAPRPKRDEVGVVLEPSDSRRLRFVAPPPQQGDIIVDHNDKPRAGASPRPKWQPSIGGFLLGRREDRLSLPTSPRSKRDAVGVSLGSSDGRLSIPTSPRSKRDAVGIFLDSPDGRRLPFVNPPPQVAIDHSHERSALAFAPSPPPKSRPSGGILLDRCEDCRSLPTSPRPERLDSSDGRRAPFLTPPPAAKPDPFGVRDTRRVLFHTPPAAAKRSLPIDPFEKVSADADENKDAGVSTTRPPKRHSFETTDMLQSPTPKSCQGAALDSGRGDHGSSLGRVAGPVGGRSSRCTPRGGGRGPGAGSARGRSSDGCVQVQATGRGSHAQALTELLGDGDRRLTPDGGPTPGQDLKEWECDRNMDLNEEYEYLDGLLRRIKALPQTGRITALARKGWVEFYMRLEVCYVVSRQMREAKADPTPVPQQLLDEVR